MKFPLRFALFKKRALWALCFLKKAKAGPSKLLPAPMKSRDRFKRDEFFKGYCFYMLCRIKNEEF